MGASPLQKRTHNAKICTHFLNGIKILDYSQTKIPTHVVGIFVL